MSKMTRILSTNVIFIITDVGALQKQSEQRKKPAVLPQAYLLHIYSNTRPVNGSKRAILKSTKTTIPSVKATTFFSSPL